jgi:hypothetical protein
MGFSQTHVSHWKTLQSCPFVRITPDDSISRPHFGQCQTSATTIHRARPKMIATKVGCCPQDGERYISKCRPIAGASMKIPSFDPDQWVCISTAARLADVHREWMRRLAKSGKVRSFAIEGQRFVFRRDAETYVRGKRGRPRSKD